MNSAQQRCLFILIYTVFVFSISAQTLRNETDPRTKTISPNCAAKDLFTVYDGKTLRNSNWIILEKEYPPQVSQSIAEISNEKLKSVKIIETKLAANENLAKVYFVDKNFGWLAGNQNLDWGITKTIYKTENGGKNWQKVPIDIPVNSYLADIFFVTSKVGWLIFNSIGTEISFLIKTSDGGKSWQTQTFMNQSRLRKLIFTDSQNGWMIGTKYDSPIGRLSSVFRSKDGGKTWTDTVESLRKQNKFTDEKAEIIDLKAKNSEEATCVTRSGRFFKTEDGGKTWKQFGINFDFLPEQVIPDNLGLAKNNRLRMARGANSEEGVFSYLATEEANNNWTLRWFNNSFCLFDIIYLSDNELVVCGHTVKNVNDDSKGFDNTIEIGVVYYSFDGGKKWSTVFQNPDLTNLNSLAKISDIDFIAVGDNGRIVKIELEKHNN